MRFGYAKWKHIPDSCPRCGRGTKFFGPLRPYKPFMYKAFARDRYRVPMLNHLSDAWDFNKALSYYYGSWRKALSRHPIWRFKIWTGNCGLCSFEDAMMAPSFLTKLKKDDSWRGGTIVVPFQTGGDK